MVTTPVTTVTIPYIKGTSETISRILQPYNIRVAHKPITTLRQLLTNIKNKDEPNNGRGAVYKIKCSDCQASYIGETGRNLNTRLTEHKRATKNSKLILRRSRSFAVFVTRSIPSPSDGLGSKPCSSRHRDFCV